ncbi:hypothetical protein O6H91_11G073200 [Diphasiastrum complanatum]|uniref:Uncharacterized protein n=3 Tax=Diphasiastrum complanatum TaxID=34168 RepID=A0ACC2CAR6_DIPCM|nr:hypothetical protein O6H91_11G073200 [Diphasiastrum complanatum]
MSLVQCFCKLGYMIPISAIVHNMRLLCVIHLLIAIILIGIFALQHFGTHKLAFMFAPIVLSWLFCIASIGLYNTLHWNPGVFRAVSPFYIYNFMKRTGREGWASLGGILLCITEAMFADLGHFSQPSIKLAFTCAVYPSLFLAYLGQAAYLTKNHTDIRSSFYKSLPRPLYWPTFVIATLASIVSSQAVISAAFSIIKQCSALGCFPRVKVIHTSKNVSGQIYIPEVNWILLVLCLAVTIGFGDAVQIGNAYGIAVLSVMFVTTFLMTLVMHIVWKWNIVLALGFCVFFGFIEGLYLSAALTKFPRGGWVPVALSVAFMAIMYSWHYGTIAKYKFNMENKVSMKWLLSLGPSLQIVRVPGIGLMYTDLATGVPAIFSHFVANLPAFHQIVVLVCVKSVPVPHVPVHERYLVGRVGPKEYRMYRCIVRFGYKDNSKDDNDFETRIMLNIGEFIQTESTGVASHDVDSDPEGKMIVVGDSNSAGIQALPLAADGQLFIPKSSSSSHIESPLKLRKKVKFDLPQNPKLDASVREELAELLQAQEAGVAYLMGHSHVRARRNSSVLKKFIINVVYNFLRRNSRGPHAVLSVPHTSLIEVGMLCLV